MDISSLFLFSIILLLTIFNFRNYLQELIYWKQQNVAALKGFQLYSDCKKFHLSSVLQKVYQQMCAKQESFRVVSSALLSTVVVQDLQAVRDIMVTHFESFPDRGSFVNQDDPLSCSLATMGYDMWKTLRQKLTPAFSPAKLRSMFPTLCKVGEQFVEVIGQHLEDGAAELNINEFCARFTTDVIGNVAFGVECNSLKDPKTEFRVYGDQAKDFNIHPVLIIVGGKHSNLFKMFNVKSFKKEITDFFVRVVRENMEYREEHSIRRNDFMDLLIELKKGDNDTDNFSLTFEMIVAHVFVFFTAGFETSSSTMAYALYELAKNDEIQQKARDSVRKVMKLNDNKLTYDSLPDMLYLQHVIQETLRMYPVLPTAGRMCRSSCTLNTDKGACTISEGTYIVIPTYGIHHNPELYPQPGIFRPERFAEDELLKRSAYSYMPFGVGPRACIGIRFAKMQVAFGLALLLMQFRFSIGQKTAAELVFSPKNHHILSVKGGIHLKVEKL